MRRDQREIDDARSMRALAHPLRLRLLELVTLRGSLTATQCAAVVGESPSSCSFHLRQLAKYGFVEEAPGGAGRNRPWQAVNVGNRWAAGPQAAPGTRAAGDALREQVERRNAELLDEYLAAADEFEPAWDAAVVHSNWDSYLTADELAAIGERLIAIWAPYLDRLTDPASRPDGARLVRMFAHGFPRADSLVEDDVVTEDALTDDDTPTDDSTPMEDDDA